MEMKVETIISPWRTSFLSRFSANQQLILDVAGMVLIIGCVSWLFRRSDPAWLDVNPSPWLLIPLLSGFRYGFREGMTAALVGAACSVLLTCLTNQANVFTLLSGNAIHYTSYLAAGGVAGFARNLLTDRTPELENEIRLLQAELNRKGAALSLLRENEVQLKQSLLLHNADFASLSDELVRIFKIRDDKEAIPEVLLLLQKTFGVLAGAIYIESKPGKLNRVAVIEDEEFELPESLGTGEKMLALALRRKKLVTCRHLWDQTSPNRKARYLAVVPVSCGKAYLVIRRMKLESISWDNFGRIETVLNYWMGGRCIETQPVSKTEFDQALESAIKLRDDFGVPGHVIQFGGTGAIAHHAAKLNMPGYYSTIGEDLCVIVMEGKKEARAFGETIATSLPSPPAKYDILSLDALHGKK